MKKRLKEIDDLKEYFLGKDPKKTEYYKNMMKLKNK